MPKLKPKKRGRKPGVKVGPYATKTLGQLYAEIKVLRLKVARLERVLH